MAEREGSFHPKGHWHWRGSWLWMPFTIEHNNIPASGASRAWEMVVVKFAYQKVSWGCERSPLPLPVCPGGVLCSQLRVGPEPCWADLESLLPLQSVLHLVLSCCSGCDGHGQLPCLLSASSDNLYKGRPIRSPSISKCPLWWDRTTLSRQWVEMMQLCSQRRMSSICTWTPEFFQPPCGHISPFTVALLLQELNSIACCAVLAIATMTSEVLREVMGHNHPKADIITMTTLALML